MKHNQVRLRIRMSEKGKKNNNKTLGNHPRSNLCPNGKREELRGLKETVLGLHRFGLSFLWRRMDPFLFVLYSHTRWPGSLNSCTHLPVQDPPPLHCPGGWSCGSRGRMARNCSSASSNRICSFECITGLGHWQQSPQRHRRPSWDPKPPVLIVDRPALS